MKYKILLFVLWSFIALGQQISNDQIRSDFRTILKRPQVPLNPQFTKIISDTLWTEKGVIFSERNERVPMLIFRPVGTINKKIPVVICLHGTGGKKENMVSIMMRFVAMGYMAVALDGRFHGDRVSANPDSIRIKGIYLYNEAIYDAWRSKQNSTQKHPFFYDTAYDVWKVVDYLVTRKDLNKKRIGMMGISKGGIETWLASSMDNRIKVIVPVIAIQSFKWSLENNQWQGRVNTIAKAHEKVAKDLGDLIINVANVSSLWNKVIPGITGKFDGPSLIRLLAPRPLLILNGEKDPNCPVEGAKIAIRSAQTEYQKLGVAENFKFDIEPNGKHAFPKRQEELMYQFFQKWL